MNEQLHILIVEDNSADADLIHELILKTGFVQFRIESVARLSDAIARIAIGGIDLIITDLGLPDSRGIETFYSINKAAPNLAIIVLTIAYDQEMAITAVRKGAQDFIVKGNISSDLLVRAIRYAIERKKLEVMLRESERNLQECLNVAAGIIVTLDVEGNIELLNKRGCDILGCLSEDSVLGKNWFDLFVPERTRNVVKQAHKDMISTKAKGECIVSEYENLIVTVHGEERAIKWRNVVFRDGEGNSYRTLSYGEDITDQKKLEKERSIYWATVEKELYTNLELLKSNGIINGKKDLSESNTSLYNRHNGGQFKDV